MILLVVALFASLTVTAYACFKVREVRKVFRHNVDAAFKSAVRRADCWSKFCDPCKRIAAPWWKP